MIFALLVTALTPIAPQFSSGVALFHGAPGELGHVKVHPESGAPGQAVAGLASVRLDSIDFVGRTSLFEFAPDRPRRVDDVPGAARLALPSQQGSLYGFSRWSGSTMLSSGYFRVAPSGQVQVLFELSAAPGNTSAFLSRIAVAPDGRSALLATLPQSGGDLYELDLITGQTILRTANVAPLNFSQASFALASDWGCAVAAEGMMRFQRTSAAQIEFVAFATTPAPTWFERQLVLSLNGQFAACVAGSSPNAEYPYVFGRTGPARRPVTAATRIAGAGFEGDAPNGPYLAVSEDGARIAWRVESAQTSYSAELFVADLSAGMSEHVTRDSSFESYIDEIGQYVFGANGRLYFVAGNASSSGSSSFTDADVFQASFASSGVSVLNLSVSSGEQLPPFTLYGTLAPRRAVWMPQSESIALYDQASSDGELMHVYQNISTSPAVLGDVESLTLLGIRGDELLFAHTEQGEFGQLELAALAGSSTSSPNAFAELGSASYVVRGVLDDSGEIALLTEHSGDVYLWRVDPTNDQTRRLTTRALPYGPSISFTAQQSIAFSIGAPGSPAIFAVWPAAQPVRRIAPGKFVGSILPGS